MTRQDLDDIAEAVARKLERMPQNPFAVDVCRRFLDWYYGVPEAGAISDILSDARRVIDTSVSPKADSAPVASSGGNEGGDSGP